MGHTKQINLPQKNNNLSGIVAVAGGWKNYSVFLDNAGNIYTCGNNQHGQLGLGDNTAERHIPQKVNNIPPIASLCSSNTAHYYLHVVDWEGRVWACGYSDLGHTFQRIQGIPGEKEIFKCILKEQNKQLMDNLPSISTMSTNNKPNRKSSKE